MTLRFDLLALGETMLSLVATDGDLLTARAFTATHGGAESNTCVALARRGLRVAWVSRLGDDPAGHRIRAHLSGEGVDLRWARTDPARPTGLMLRDTVGGVRYWRSGSAASALGPSDLDDVPIEEARALLVTGITAMLGAGPRAAATSFLARGTGIRAIDPNLRPGLPGSADPRAAIGPLIERCSVVLGGESELQIVIGSQERGGALARAVARLGPSEVVIKRGDAGAAVLDPQGGWHEHRPRPGAEIDPVGAGDAFNAGYLAARLRGAMPSDALLTGAAEGGMAARTFGDVGPREREPMRESFDEVGPTRGRTNGSRGADDA